MSDHFLQLRVIHEDPHLIELGVRVSHREWSSYSTAYTSPSMLSEAGVALQRWIDAPRESLTVEAGADTGIGWMRLKFYVIDAACHAACAITVASGYQSQGARPEETWRLAVEMATEIGLIQKFAEQCIALGQGLRDDARLTGIGN
jgi:hypothetical protein